MNAVPQIYIDWGPELAPAYREDIIVAMVRDPECLVFYWDVAPENEGLPLVARVHCLNDGTYFDLDLPEAKAAWHIPLESNRIYQVELLARRPDASLYALAASEEVSLPVRHAWQAGHRPAELIHAERRPLSRRVRPAAAAIYDAPESRPVASPIQCAPTPAPAPAPRSAAAPARPGGYVNFGEEA